MNLHSHLRATLRLAAPVMVSRLGILTIVAVDTAMTGWAGTRELAALAISAAPHTPLLLIGVGLCTGTIVLASQAEGAGKHRESGFILRAAWRQAWIAGVVLLGLFHTGEWSLLALGQSPSLALEGAEGITVMSAGTDGTDGPTDAAGAVADGTTVARAAAAGLQAPRHLDGNDAYPLFEALGDLIVTGPTGTNVMDLRLVLVG